MNAIHLLTHPTTIETALSEASVYISETFYTHPRYVSDKSIIRGSFNLTYLSDDCGTVIDTSSGAVYLVLRVSGDSKWWYLYAINPQAQLAVDNANPIKD